jgi:FMN phosphatase YigB (HAD superfamily)
MTFSLLLDLDDTLLDTNIDAFLAAYFKTLAKHMSTSIPPEQFTRALLRSTQIMYASRRADLTLEQVFSENFYPALGFDQLALSNELDKFYDEVFPTLASLTTPRPEAVSLVEWAFSKGWNVAIATDPLFPRKAILHRLRWAGLAPEKYPFTLISDYQNFHFAKASVAYYPEFLAKMNWTDSPVLMVGDSLERDVLPSRQAGIPVFWLKANGQESQPGIPQGWYAELKNYLETTDLRSLKVDYSAPQALVTFLEATPAVLHTQLLTTPRAGWTQRPQPGEWSLLEILCHLRDVDLEVNLPRVEAILAEENAFITGQSTDQWADERQYAQQDPDQALADFVAARAKLVNRLSGLEPADWERRARHTFLGPTSLRELAEIMVDHDRLHMQQAAAAIIK